MGMPCTCRHCQRALPLSHIRSPKRCRWWDTLDHHRGRQRRITGRSLGAVLKGCRCCRRPQLSGACLICSLSGVPFRARLERVL
eukprot:3756538-Pyramimonas_sp.AAC.1